MEDKDFPVFYREYVNTGIWDVAMRGTVLKVCLSKYNAAVKAFKLNPNTIAWRELEKVMYAYQDAKINHRG